MQTRIERNQRFLASLFAGDFRGHALIFDPEPPEYDWASGGLASSPRPVKDFIPSLVQYYERRCRILEQLDDDSVPYAPLWTGTEVFASAFGCQVYIPPGSLPAARPLVRTAEEADALKVPSLHVRPLERIFEAAQLLLERLGKDVIIGVPDIQSPFDVAALIWEKQSFYLALIEQPDAVKRLVAKCRTLIENFLQEFLRQVPNPNLCHCPYAWAPPELGCWLSEDEAGSMSAGMFEEFCLPELKQLSQKFGGLFVHCCATADHQYPNLLKIPNLRGINRVFQAPGPRPAIEAFSGKTVLMMAWIDEATAYQLLDMALPNTRFLFNMPYQPIDEAKRTYERLRARCPRKTEEEV